MLRCTSMSRLSRHPAGIGGAVDDHSLRAGIQLISAVSVSGRWSKVVYWPLETSTTFMKTICSMTRSAKATTAATFVRAEHKRLRSPSVVGNPACCFNLDEAHIRIAEDRERC